MKFQNPILKFVRTDKPKAICPFNKKRNLFALSVCNKRKAVEAKISTIF